MASLNVDTNVKPVFGCTIKRIFALFFSQFNCRLFFLLQKKINSANLCHDLHWHHLQFGQK